MRSVRDVSWVHRAACAAALVVLGAAGAAGAAEWKPMKRVELVVPNAPGGGNDRLARLIQKIAADRGLVDQVMTIVNKPGAGVVVGLTYLNQQGMDGHHLSMVSATLVGDYISGRSTMGPDDITPVAQLFTEYVGFAVKADSPIRSGQDLVARLKADAASVSASYSGGPGNHNHVALAIVAKAAGADPRKLRTVVFNAGAEAITAALGGHVDLVMSPAATLLPHVQGGRLRFIALTAPKRLGGPYAAAPVWTELGTNAVVSNWRAIVGPKSMTAPQIAYWENVLARVVDADDWKAMLEKSQLVSGFLRSADARKELREEIVEMRQVMTELGLVK